jgi:hypothetical protein
MSLAGSCHCGNLRFELETALPPAALPLRACQCSFCRAHGAISTSDPQGSVSVSAADRSMVQKYRFGLGITEFLICRRCGVYLAAVAEMEGRRYAVLNANALERRDELSGAVQPMDYEGEDAAARRVRRQARWTPVSRLEGLDLGN